MSEHEVKVPAQARNVAFAPRLLLACLVASSAWIVCEVAGGLTFLAFGVRLWRYEILPLFAQITSPVVWGLAAALILPLAILFERGAGIRRLPPFGRAASRLLFLMCVGPVVEVLLNEHLFVPFLGRPLYRYLVLPTFEGSGSLLSPLYYATLYLHVPITDKLLQSRAERMSPSS